MSDRKQKKIEVYSEGRWCGDWPPASAVECVAWFSEKISKIPKENLDSARIDIDRRTEYDSSYPTIEICYFRPETDEEMAARESAAARSQEAQKQLAELKARYESGVSSGARKKDRTLL